uniref:Uncharacterized protein n=1 Tax=viral metagenome TaxID=1070528 RepID=A0A6C0BZN9_9ZZZZ
MKNIITQASSHESTDLVRLGVEMYEAAVKTTLISSLYVVTLAGVCFSLFYLCARLLDEHEFKRRSAVVHVDLAENCGLRGRRASARDSSTHRITSALLESPRRNPAVSSPHQDVYYDASGAVSQLAADEPLSSSMPQRSPETLDGIAGHGSWCAADHLSVRRVN